MKSGSKPNTTVTSTQIRRGRASSFTRRLGSALNPKGPKGPLVGAYPRNTSGKILVTRTEAILASYENFLMLILQANEGDEDLEEKCIGILQLVHKASDGIARNDTDAAISNALEAGEGIMQIIHDILGPLAKAELDKKHNSKVTKALKSRIAKTAIQKTLDHCTKYNLKKDIGTVWRQINSANTGPIEGYAVRTTDGSTKRSQGSKQESGNESKSKFTFTPERKGMSPMSRRTFERFLKDL